MAYDIKSISVRKSGLKERTWKEKSKKSKKSSKKKGMFKGKLLSKPKKELVKKIDVRKVVSQLARETSPQLVREGRTGHFQEVYEKEKKKMWLGGYSL